MEEWDRLMAGKAFITDLGKDRTVIVKEEEQTLGRYAVWSPLKNRNGHTILEISSDLALLMQRHGIPFERVCVVRSKE